MHPIVAIQPDSRILKTYTLTPRSLGICGFRTINLFCGPNNSGKSRFLRYMFSQAVHKQTPIFRLSGDRGFDESHIGQVLSKYYGELSGNARHLLREIYFASLVKKTVDINLLRVLLRDESLPQIVNDTISSKHQLELATNQCREAIAQASGQTKTSQSAAVYIPANRMARSIGDERSIYSYLKEKYFSQISSLSEVNIATGRNLYSSIKSHLLGTLSQRKAIADLQTFLSKWFFDDQEVTLCPNEGDTELHVRIGFDTERPLNQLGDGIQHIITIISNLFIIPGDGLSLFIEEPELYLHPGLQRRLIEALLHLAENNTKRTLQVFATTHSNHLLDSTIDDTKVSVFRFRKLTTELPDGADKWTHQSDAMIEIVSDPDRTFELLDDIGVRRSSVFLTNCTIWVEGPTDRLLLRKLFETYRNKVSPTDDFVEDRDYSFVLYGGSLLTAWDFLDETGPDASRLCADALVICDGDIRQKSDRGKKLEESLGDRVHILDCKEVENVLSASYIRKFIAATEEISEDDLNAVEPADYANEGIGSFVDRLLEGHETSRKYADKDGGLTNYWKKKLCDAATSGELIQSDVTDAGWQAAKRILEFIKQYNS